VYRLYLRAKLIWHWRSVGLVLCINFAAKRFSLGIKNYRYITVLIALYEAANHVDDALHGSRWLPFAAYERRQCMECTKQIRRSIYKNELF